MADGKDDNTLRLEIKDHAPISDSQPKGGIALQLLDLSGKQKRIMREMDQIRFYALTDDRIELIVFPRGFRQENDRPHALTLPA